MEGLEGRWAPAVLTVTTAADSGPGSLRQAILDANVAPGLDTINFSIHSGLEIALSSPLPAVTDSAVIDGSSAPDWFPGGGIVLDGSAAGPGDGLDLLAPNTSVLGLEINDFAGSGALLYSSSDVLQGNFLINNALDGVTVAGGSCSLAGNLISNNGRCGVFLSGADGCVLQGNRIGTNIAGTDALPNAAGGVAAVGPIPSLTISQNLISGNRGSGVTLFQTGASLSGNFIGTSAAGTAAVPNGGYGVALLNGGDDSVGGPGAAGNLISGNALSGVLLDGALGNVQVAGNKVGTDTAGTAALPNGGDGVTLLNSGGVTVGGAAAGEGNVLSGNGGSGVFLFNSPGAVIQGNRVGTDASGTAARGNVADGVTLSVGTSAVAIRGNVLSGNGRAGVLIGGGPDDGNVVQGNQIGADASGTAALGNGVAGVVVYDGADGNTIGGTASGDGNLIAGNGGPGLILADLSRANLVQGNTIGGALGNDGDGVRVSDSDGNTLGGTVAAAGNVISGNQGFGVALVGEGSFGNLVQGNRIGTLADGTTPLGNASDGVYVANQAHDNTVGGTAAGAANVIAFNGNDGVLIGLDSDFDTVPAGTGNAVEGNSIHDNSALGIDLSGGSENFFGVTANDLGQPPDADTGPNDLQNYPVITEVAPGVDGGTDVTFTLESMPNTSFRVEFFANDAANGSGFGEGQTFLGFVTVVTDASGHFAQTMNVAGTVVEGQTVTATATDPSGNTSEFSADFPQPR